VPDKKDPTRKSVTRKGKGKKNNKDKKLQSRNRLLSSFTEDAMHSYFNNLNGHKPADIYRMVLGEVEPPLLKAVMEYTEGNQTLAADMLGLNRATLRKKLRQYDLRG